MEVRSCSGMVQICTLSSTGVNSPNLPCAVTLVFLCSPQMPRNSVTQTAVSIWVQFLASLDFLDLRSRSLKQLGLVITKSGLTCLLSEHIASARAGARHSFALDQSQRQALAVESSVNGIISKKTSINLSTSNGQSRQRAHQKDLTRLCGSTSVTQHTCNGLDRNMSSEFT